MFTLEDVMRIHRAGEDASAEALHLIERRARAVRRALERHNPRYATMDCTLTLPPAYESREYARIRLTWSDEGRSVRSVTVPLETIEDGSEAAAEAFVKDLERQLDEVIAHVERMGQTAEETPTTKIRPGRLRLAGGLLRRLGTRLR